MNEKIKQHNKILVMLAFFALSVGLWTNFKELWLQSNSLNVSQISKILSISTFIAAFIVVIISLKINIKHIVGLIKYTLLIKVLVMFLLFVFNGSDNRILLYVFITIDMILEKIYITSIYPLITLIKKDDDFYAKRKLTEYLFRDVGVFIGAIFIGKNILNFNINYNLCLFFSMIIMLLSFIMTCSIKIKTNEKSKKISLKQIFNDKINNIYFAYGFFANIAMKTALGLKMLMLTNKLNFSVSTATMYALIIGLCADIIGIIVLKKFTFKNNYLNIFIKFGIRNIMYLIAFLSNNITIILIAMSWSLLMSTSYENITEAPYINRINKEEQLLFNSIRYGIWILGESIGLLLAGITYSIGLNYMLGVSALFISIQVIFQIDLIKRTNNKYFIKAN